MDIERAKELLPIIQAFAEGKKIECSVKGEDAWSDTFYPTWIDSRDYRIKPEPKYRPFKDADECWEEIKKHEPFGWIVNDTSHHLITSINHSFIWISPKIYYAFGEAIETFTFADGTPFGIKEN